jgi:hypothetical protein
VRIARIIGCVVPRVENGGGERRRQRRRGREEMVEFVILPVVLAAGAVYDRMKVNLGSIAAMKWMLSACDELDGVSPLQAIKAGRADDVWRVTECLQDS